MPKSLARIVEEAQSTQSSSRIVEQRQLGADHTILGKRLAQKWRLPEEITLAIWLHHSDTAAVSQAMPAARSPSTFVKTSVFFPLSCIW